MNDNLTRQCGKCDALCLNAGKYNIRISFCEKYHEHKPTNFDRIKNMSVEKMAEFLFENSTKPIICAYMQPKTNCNCTCVECFARWLESEASE
jgi:hypothetical protein